MTVDSCSYNGQMLSPTANYMNEPLRFSFIEINSSALFKTGKTLFHFALLMQCFLCPLLFSIILVTVGQEAYERTVRQQADIFTFFFTDVEICLIKTN